jgi:hypothetical protein
MPLVMIGINGNISQKWSMHLSSSAFTFVWKL